jgi:adenylate kinase family enzyme
MPKTYVFFGNVGAGKGTQIALLTQFLKERHEQNAVYVYPGAEFRALVSQEGYTNNLVKETLDQGVLQPNFITNWVFTNALVKNLQNPGDYLFVDGYPRNLEQVDVFESAMHFYGRDAIELVYIDVSKEEAVRRMKLRARSDDTEDAIATRFEVYEKDVLPALKKMEKHHYKIHHINGEQSVDGVQDALLHALGLK